MRNPDRLYDIWFVPTQKGRYAFGYKEHKIAGKPECLEDAQLSCYLIGCDDPAPDKAEYGKYEIRETCPERGPHLPSEDLKSYREMQGCMNHMRGKFGAVVAMMLPEYQAAWRASEAIKNRHGGMPPNE